MEAGAVGVTRKEMCPGDRRGCQWERGPRLWAQGARLKDKALLRSQEDVPGLGLGRGKSGCLAREGRYLWSLR